MYNVVCVCYIVHESVYCIQYYVQSVYMCFCVIIVIVCVFTNIHKQMTMYMYTYGITVACLLFLSYLCLSRTIFYCVLLLLLLLVTGLRHRAMSQHLPPCWHPLPHRPPPSLDHLLLLPLTSLLLIYCPLQGGGRGCKEGETGGEKQKGYRRRVCVVVREACVHD